MHPLKFGCGSSEDSSNMPAAGQIQLCPLSFPCDFDLSMLAERAAGQTLTTTLCQLRSDLFIPAKMVDNVTVFLDQVTFFDFLLSSAEVKVLCVKSCRFSPHSYPFLSGLN